MICEQLHDDETPRPKLLRYGLEERSISYQRSEFPNVEVGAEYSLRFTKHDGTQREERWRCVAIGEVAEAPGEWVTLMPSGK